jgi:hypothetical protein
MPIMKKYLSWQRLLYKSSTGNEAVKDRGGAISVPLNALVETDNIRENGREFIVYRNWVGWVEAEFLEPYNQTLRTNCVDLSDIETPDIYDPKQNIIWKNERIVNACGLISVAYILDKKPSEILQDWEAAEPKHYRYVDGQNWLTSIPDLQKILEVNSTPSEILRKPRWTPNTLHELLKENYIIAGVGINGRTGALKPFGVRHWVVLESIWHERYGGTIDLYNPFPNCWERYQWENFVAAAGNVNALIVKRC